MSSSGGRAFEHKRRSTTGVDLAFSGRARSPVSLLFSLSLPKPPYACCGLHEQSCLIKNFALFLFFYVVKGSDWWSPL